MPDRGLKLIKENFETKVWTMYDAPPKAVLLKEVKECDGLASLLTDQIDKEIMDSARKLGIISQMAVGFDNIDIEEATKRGIYVTNTPGVLTDTTADLAFTLLMAVARRVVEADRYVKKGDWRTSWHPLMFLGLDIHGSTLGIIGLGRIGEALARRAKGFDMEILYYDINRRQDVETKLGIKYVDLDTLLRDADFISLHVALSGETLHLMGEDNLKKMKKSSYLINTSRGKVVDEKALYHALKNGQIAGAALDVFEEEPTPRHNPLLTLQNVVTVPHIASASFETRAKMAAMVAENLIAFFNGEIPPNLVNQDVVKIRKPAE